MFVTDVFPLGTDGVLTSFVKFNKTFGKNMSTLKKN